MVSAEDKSAAAVPDKDVGANAKAKGPGGDGKAAGSEELGSSPTKKAGSEELGSGPTKKAGAKAKGPGGKAAAGAKAKGPGGKAAAGAKAKPAAEKGRPASYFEYMPAEGEKRKRAFQRRANLAAALTLAFVGLFAVAFIGVVTLLNDYAESLQNEGRLQASYGAKVPDDPLYVLLVGSDSRKGTAVYNPKTNASHAEVSADAITLMRVDPQDYRITLLTIPRDTVITGESQRICSSLNSENPQDVVDAVQTLTGVKVDAYLMTTYISFENLINAIGGIDVDVFKTVTVADPATGKNVTVKKGRNQHLNGAQALVLARAREEYDGKSDALRQLNVRNIERAMMEKVIAMNGDFDIDHVVAALRDDTKTNMDTALMGTLMLMFVAHPDDVTIYTGTGTYVGAARPSDNMWVIPQDEQAWEDVMAAVNEGKDPSQVIVPPSF